MNILYLHCHDTGRYISPYGYAADTQNLMKLAENGVVMRDMHCASPSCSPSRAALLTGMYPHNAGMMGLVNRGFDLEKTENHLAKWLSVHGYTTILAGIQHVVKDRNKSGYDKVLQCPDINRSMQIAENGMNAITADLSKPFFLDIGLFDTHRPFEDEHLTSNPNYIMPPTPIPDTPETRKDMAGYLTEASSFDKVVGYIMDELEKRGLIENTLVICTTDHGLAFPNMKCTLTKHGTGVFCIWSLPNKLPKGIVCDALSSQIDIFPTICEVANLPSPPWLQGVSLLPVLNGEKNSVQDEVFAEVNYHCSYEPQRVVRTSRYVYIRRYTEIDTVYCANCDEGYTKKLWVKNDWASRHIDKEQLYDSMFDPVEADNRVNDPEYKPVLEDLRRCLYEWQTTTGDPILEGIITNYSTNTPDENIYVSASEDINTYELWERTVQPEGYA